MAPDSSATSGSTTARIAWSPPLSNGGQAISGYTARLYDAGGALIRTSGTLTTATTSYTFTGLANGTGYLVDVFASSDASVVDFPEPVGPVMSTRPRGR